MKEEYPDVGPLLEVDITERVSMAGIWTQGVFFIT